MGRAPRPGEPMGPVPYPYAMPFLPQYDARTRGPVMPPQMIPMSAHMPMHHSAPPPQPVAHPVAHAPMQAPPPNSAPATTSEDNQAAAPMPTVYLATYSSVPVYEITVRGIALMRRRSDGYLNATQILKIAGIEKARRTRILEKEILTGEHDKVQGGFGTFQGTWIPLRRAQELATAYSVYHLIRPLLEFDVSVGNAPQPAPTATKRKAAPEAERQQTNVQQPRFLSLRPPREDMPQAQVPVPPPQAPVGQWIPPPQWPYPHEQRDMPDPAPVTDLNALGPSGGTLRAASGPAKPRQPLVRFADKALAPNLEDERERRMREVLTDLFVANGRANGAPRDGETPEAALSRLLSELSGSVNLVIDDHGHTALHWAAALCKLPLVRMLTSIPPERGGANIFAGNYQGETALHRSVLVTNSYESSQFPELLASLEASLNTRDNRKRTVLHHIALVAGLRGRAAPARYYLGCVLDRIASQPGQRTDLLDAQDDEGETALSITARLGNTHMIKMLLDAGARKDLPNYLGITPLDWGICAPDDDDGSSRTVMSELASLRPSDMVKSLTRPPQGPVLKSHDVREKLASTLDELHAVFDREVAAKHAAIESAQVQLQTATRELAARRRHIAAAQRAVVQREETRIRTENLERALTEMLGKEGLAAAERELPEVKQHTVDAVLAGSSDKSVVALRWAVKWLRERSAALRAEIETVKGNARSRELRCRRVVAMCAHVPIDKVDDILDELLVSVESIGQGVDVDSVASFMHKRMQSEQPEQLQQKQGQQGQQGQQG
ncbi:transcriptional regulator swi6 [Malassezia cuniculi]|uniref:Transcriptional regulator swi6 n=1 Tax=Malassezia cuniculi TaxID=948313 RepID=A0AAF0JBZ4_9BASI|nr:transcriptional regulator swi6 [Malassezia cuniculi]